MNFSLKIEYDFLDYGAFSEKSLFLLLVFYVMWYNDSIIKLTNPSSKEIRISYYGTRKFLASMISLLLLFVFILPIFVQAALVTCDNSANNPCNFNAIVGTINNIINWIISIAGVIFTISAIYGGFLYLTSGENPGNKTKAKSILWSTLIGFVIILTSWLIVHTILIYLAPGNTTISSFIGN